MVDRRARSLEDRVRELEERLQRIEAGAPTAAQQAQWPPAPVPYTYNPETSDQGLPGQFPHPLRYRDGLASPVPPAPARSPATTGMPPYASAPAQNAAPAQPAARPVQRPTRDIEQMLGANWLARAGVLVIALGIVFFLKLAYDRNWVPLTGRFAIGVVAGLALFALGDVLRTRKVNAAFTQILSAGGAVITYITIYLAWLFADYRAALGLTIHVELTLLALVSAGVATYATWRNLPVLAGVAVVMAGILLAPAGQFSTVGLLYVAFLNGAILMAAAWRGWGPVVLTATVASNIAHLLALTNGVDWRLTAASSVAVNLLAMLAGHRAREGVQDFPTGTVVGGAGAGLQFLILALALDAGQVTHPWGWAALAVGVASLGGAFVSRPLAQGLAPVGAILLLLWPMLHFPWELAQPLAYAGLAWAAWALTWPLPGTTKWSDAFSVAAAALGTLALFGNGLFYGAANDHPWQTGALALLLLGAAGAQWVRTNASGFSQTSGAGLGVSVALLLAWPFVQFEASLSQTLTLALSALGLGAAAVAWNHQGRTLRLVAVACAGVGVLSLLALAGMEDVARSQPWSSGGLALLLLGATAALWLATREGRDGPVTPVVALAVGCVLLLIWPFVQFPDSLYQTLTLALVAAALAAAGIFWAPGRRILHFVAAAAGGVAIGSLYVLAQQLDSVHQYPLQAGGITAILLGSAAALWWIGREQQDEASRPTGLALLTLAPIVYLGLLLDGWGIAVAWAVEGLALAGAGLFLRELEVRIASFAVFGLVLARIFLIDFQSLDLPFRVLTFLCTGAVLLLAAYLFARQRKDPDPTPEA